MINDIFIYQDCWCMQSEAVLICDWIKEKQSVVFFLNSFREAEACADWFESVARSCCQWGSGCDRSVRAGEGVASQELWHNMQVTA